MREWGDIAETISLVMPQSLGSGSELSLCHWVEERLETLRHSNDEERLEKIRLWWSELSTIETFVFNKMITGGMRVGVSQTLLIRALSEWSGVERSKIAHRFMGHWDPTPSFFHQLISPDVSETDHSKPYPFYLASPVEGSPQELGELDHWQVEWKWDGIRSQLIKREGQCHLWSRGEELLTQRFPEIVQAAESLQDGMVMDGEILAYAHPEESGTVPPMGLAAPLDFLESLKNDSRSKVGVLPFAVLQKRIGRKKVGPKILSEAPTIFLAYDLLEFEGEDWRAEPLSHRRENLERVLQSADSHLKLSPFGS